MPQSIDEQLALGERAQGRRPPGAQHGLGKDSVANLSQVITIDETLLSERVGRVSRAQIDLLLAALDVVLGR